MESLFWFVLQTPGNSSAGLKDLLLMGGACVMLFYFMLIRPQKKERARHMALLEAIKKNDQVRTSAGIFGKVVSVEKDKGQVVLKIDETNNVRMRVLRSTIVDVITDKKQ